MVLVFFLLNLPDLPSKKMSLKDKLQQLNALGLLALVPGVICLCLALQWGGSTYAVSYLRRNAPRRLSFCCVPMELIASSGITGE